MQMVSAIRIVPRGRQREQAVARLAVRIVGPACVVAPGGAAVVHRPAVLRIGAHPHLRHGGRTRGHDLVRRGNPRVPVPLLAVLLIRNADRQRLPRPPRPLAYSTVSELCVGCTALRPPRINPVAYSLIGLAPGRIIGTLHFLLSRAIGWPIRSPPASRPSPPPAGSTRSSPAPTPCT